jgi:hypothetical protein
LVANLECVLGGHVELNQVITASAPQLQAEL